MWFAFRLYLWLIDSQQLDDYKKLLNSCDLLSDCIFDLLIHSKQADYQIDKLVVICFQIVSLTYWFTAPFVKVVMMHKLWFAFRLYLWLIDSQLVAVSSDLSVCCDLLSDCIFDLLIHSVNVKKGKGKRVVICFQIVSLTYWFTALAILENLEGMLWFAFRLYLWLIDSQPEHYQTKIWPRCDLLSDCIFDLLIHSTAIRRVIWLLVVICFQIVSLTYWFTAGGQ